MQRNMIRTVVLAGALLGIGILHAYSLSIQPDEVMISQLGDNDGKFVITKGYVTELSTQHNEIRMTIRWMNSSAAVFMDQGEELSMGVGDLVEIVGKVFSYNGDYAVTVSGKMSFRILEKWESTMVTLPGLSADPWSFEGRNINLSCRIRIALTDKDGYAYAIVEDCETRDYSLTIFSFGVDVQRWYAGARVFANARFQYQAKSLGFNCVIDSPEHHIWGDPNQGNCTVFPMPDD